MKPKIKLCGMMRSCDIEFANAAMPDYVGFVFADTRRRVTMEQAAKFRTMLFREIQAVGVFVNADVTYVGRLFKEGIINIAQLHGNEDAAYISRLREISDMPIIKAVKVTCAEDIRRAAELDADYLLLDTYRKGVPGGTGERFDWDIIDAVRGHKREQTICGKPFFLAGGLTPDNLKEAAAVGAYGLDISTGIETDGYKDRDKMLESVQIVRCCI